MVDTLVSNFLQGQEDINNENANKDASVISTQRDLLAGAISKDYALNNLLPEHVAKAHAQGDIHVHDLDYSLYGYFNCMLIDFPEMLNNGFTLGNTSIKEVKSIRTAAALIPQIILNCSSTMYGGISAHRIDDFLTPFAYKSYNKHLEKAKKWISDESDQVAYAEEMTQKEIYDACQNMEYEINTCANANGQTPFITFNFGLSTDKWGREIQKAILQVRIEGLGVEKKTAVFPKLVFTLKEGVNKKPQDVNYDIKQLALKCASLRIYPDILDYDKIMELYGFFVSPMGCRSFLSKWEKDGEAITYGRRNMGVATVNLPRIALQTDSPEEFFQLLEERMGLIREALLYRYRKIIHTKAKTAPVQYMYAATGHRLQAEDEVGSIFAKGEATMSIGYIGVHETCVKFFGADWQSNKDAKAFSLDIMLALNNYKDQWNSQYNLGFGVYGTPAESLTHRFSTLDKEKFGVIEGITDKGWYTNSFHLTPTKQVDPFTKIDFEKDYEKLSLGGHICYVEMPSLVSNVDALEALWDYATNDRLSYFGVNSPISHCDECGFHGDFQADAKGYYCPSCGCRDPKKIYVIQRMCGYLSEVSARPPITGRRKEIASRVKHGVV